MEPFCPNTISTVLNKILISSINDHSAIYWVSSLTTSSKSVISLRPLTCHIPVRPGLIARRALWCSSYFSHSSTVGGRVPMRLISPFNTLKNCGNSSSEVLRMKFPIPLPGPFSLPITRGSFSILNIRPSLTRFCFISSFFRSSASMYILRNL